MGPRGVAVTHANDMFDDAPDRVVVIVGKVHGLLYLGLGEVIVDDGDDQCWFLNLAVGLVFHLDELKFHILVLVIIWCN